MEKMHYEEYSWGYESFRWGKTGYPVEIDGWVHDDTAVNDDWLCLLATQGDYYEFHEILNGRQDDFMLISDDEFQELGGEIHDGSDGTTMYLIPDKYVQSIFNMMMEKLTEFMDNK